MAKYYIVSGDLRKIVSTNMSPKMACKVALEDFIENNRHDKEKSVSTDIVISQKGFRCSDGKVQYKYDDAVYYDVLDIVDHIN